MPHGLWFLIYTTRCVPLPSVNSIHVFKCFYCYPAKLWSASRGRWVWVFYLPEYNCTKTMSSYGKGCLLRPTSSLWFNACHKVVNVCSEIYLLMWNCSTSFPLSSWRVFLVFFLCCSEVSFNSCHGIVEFEYSVIMRIPKRSFTTYLTFLSWVLFAALAWCFFQLTVSENGIIPHSPLFSGVWVTIKQNS